jgi:predicted ribosomally synthesized peptide with SipW-like signal peptide
MNKKIVISLSVIGVVAAIAIGGTVAYFSDTETSTGNTFTAGSLDLTVDNECYYNGELCTNGYWGGIAETGNECACTWVLSDLDDKVFFSFDDLKPGDWGEDTVSLHVTNDAWACVTFDSISSNEVSCTEPESKVDPDGSTCEPSGELDDELYFAFWIDICAKGEASPGDNVYQPGCDIDLMYGPASTLGTGPVTYTLADADENNIGSATGYLEEGETYYIGKAWCFGEMTVAPFPAAYPGQPPISCDGQAVGNQSQTDSLSGTIEFYAEQWRNNPNFQCVQ